MAEVNESRDAATPAPAQPEGARSGIVGWFSGVFFDPNHTFVQIASSTERPHPTDPGRKKDCSKWWVPFLISLLVTGVLVGLATSYMIPEQIPEIRELLQGQGQTEEQIEHSIEIAKKVGPITAALLVTALSVGLFFAAAGLAHLLSRVLGGKGRFRVARATLAYSSLATVLGSIITIPMMVLRKTAFVEFGPTLLFPDLGPKDFAYRLLTQFNLFMILWVVLLTIGLAAGYRISKGKAIAPAIVAWGVYALIALVSGGGGPSGG